MIRKKKNITFIIVLVLLFLGIGYAYLTTTLSINGVTDVDSNSWDVHWNNVQVTNGSVTGDQVTTAPTIGVNGTTVSYHIRLKEPGDYYEFTVDAKNDGTLDAMIGTISSKLNNVEITTLPAYLRYSVTYFYGGTLEENHLLAANSSEKYKVRIEYRNDIEPSSLPSAAQSLSLSLSVEYRQADSSAIAFSHTVYSFSPNAIVIGELMPTNINLYNSYDESILVNSYPYFTKTVINNNGIVNNSMPGILINNEVYYLQPGGSSYDSYSGYYNYDSIYYESNKNILHSIFGQSNCEDFNEFTYRCVMGDLLGLARTDGNVFLGDINIGCYCTNITCDCNQVVDSN